MDEIIARISNAFKGPLPGWDAQKRMINYKRPRPDNIANVDPNARQGAVLALLYPKNGELHTVLMLRNVYEGTHSGQVSFPGGKQEVFDKTLWHTALREANEEVGIKAEEVLKIGNLTQVYIPPSRFLVSPFLAYSNVLPNFIADEIEVQKIIEAPISAFLEPSKILEKRLFIESLKTEIDIKYYEVEGETVWGATAMMLSEISEIIRNTGASIKI